MSAHGQIINGVSLHTEAESIRDWESVCDHIAKRLYGITNETQEFLKLFQSLTETYKQYRDMCHDMRTTITTQKEYIEVPDYHETYVFLSHYSFFCKLQLFCTIRMYTGAETI